MEFRKNAILILMSIVIIILGWSLFSSSGENKRLRDDIKEKLKRIETIELQKSAIFETVKKDSLRIATQEKIIEKLKVKEDSLNINLKLLKNERIKIQNAYLGSAVGERIRIFTELATQAN